MSDKFTKLATRTTDMLFLLFVLASSIVLIFYGEKMRKKNISAKDIKAGQFITALGAIGLISSLSVLFILSHMQFGEDKFKTSKFVQLIMLILFYISTNITLIIYGDRIDKINKDDNEEDIKNNKNINDTRAGEFLIGAGSISMVIALGFFITKMLYKVNKNS
jgi:hypothetical protein